MVQYRPLIEVDGKFYRVKASYQVITAQYIEEMRSKLCAGWSIKGIEIINPIQKKLPIYIKLFNKIKQKLKFVDLLAFHGREYSSGQKLPFWNKNEYQIQIILVQINQLGYEVPQIIQHQPYILQPPISLFQQDNQFIHFSIPVCLFLPIEQQKKRKEKIEKELELAFRYIDLKVFRKITIENYMPVQNYYKTLKNDVRGNVCRTIVIIAVFISAVLYGLFFYK